jgi:hypothetical protein
MMTIIKTPHYSWRRGTLPQGCAMCIKGEKLVLFIGGICNRWCFYCPLSDQKQQKDVIYANEWCAGKGKRNLTVQQQKILVTEARLCNAKGAGITGGDPLLVNDRTVDAIKFLKKRFGQAFHIHLYTTVENITIQKLATLYAAGLDEIRLHPIVWNERLWHKLDLLKAHPWRIGIEIPAIPGYEKETKRLLDFANTRVHFVNLNELEISDTNANQLLQKGFVPKNRISYGVLGSESLAKKLLRYVEKKQYNYTVHYCTCTLKDKVQLAERLKRRAQRVRTSSEIVTSEGMLVRGVVYLKSFVPGVGYTRKLQQVTTKQRTTLLRSLAHTQDLLKKKGIPITMDTKKYRLVLHPHQLKKQLQQIPEDLVPAIVTEYPTSDGMTLEIDFLQRKRVNKTNKRF